MLTAQNSAALEGFERLPDAAHVRLPVVQALFACSDETIRRRVLAGLIPKPRKLGPRVTAWNVGELRRALAA
jgi:predicted DNA-binding transcriptional regulator AlpA